MATTTVSSKYQIVIPRKVREQLSIQPGQTIYVDALETGEVVLSTKSALDRTRRRYIGSKLWGDNPDTYISEMRADRNINSHSNTK